MQQMLTEDLQDLLIVLRREKFSIGIDTIIKIERLVQTIVATGKGLAHPVDFSSVLAPIVCKNAQDQERFKKLYIAWNKAHQSEVSTDNYAITQKLTQKVLTVDQKATSDIEETGKKKRALTFWAKILGLSLIAFIVSIFFIDLKTDVIEPVQTINPREINPNLFPKILDTNIPSITPNIEPSPNGLMRIILALIILIVPWAYKWIENRRIRVLNRRFTTRLPRSRAISLQTANQLFFNNVSADRCFQLLRQHRIVQGLNLDVRRTLNHVVRSAGLTQVYYEDRKILPEHLLLVDRYSDADHLRGVADRLQRSLHEANAPVIRYEFRKDPRILRRWNYFTGEVTQRVTLKDLIAQYSEHRLIILTEATGLVNSLNGRPHDWVNDFEIWQRRTILTPKPESLWENGEYQLEAVGFIVAQADSTGLENVSNAFLAEESTEILSRNLNQIQLSRVIYPPMLEDDPYIWLNDQAPDNKIIKSLLSEIKLYLGQQGFIWCCACAAFPKLSPELTFHLGVTLEEISDQPLGNEKDLLAMSRLPWFRQGFMPDWFRLALLSKLSKEQMNNIRTTLTDVLMTAKTEVGSGLVLNISKGSTAMAAEFITRPGPNDPFNPMQEEIFISVLKGRELPSLSIVAPTNLVQAVRQRIDNLQNRMWLTACLIAMLVWWKDPWPLLQALEISLYFPFVALVFISLMYFGGNAGKDRGLNVSGIWFGSSLAIFFMSMFYFDSENIKWFGMSRDYNSGLVFGCLVAIGSGLFLVWKRWKIISSAETVFYWFGSSLAFIFMSGIYFDSESIEWFGMGGDLESGVILGCLSAISSGVLLVWKNRRIISGTEIVFYWIGCSLALIFMSAFYFTSENINWFGMNRDGNSGFVFGFLLSLGSAFFLIWKRRKIITGTEIVFYWFVCSQAFMWMAVFYMDSENIKWFGVRGAHTSGFVFGGISALGSGFFLIWKRRMMITGTEIVFYWIGCSLAFILMSLFYFDSENIKWFGMRKDIYSGLVFGCLLTIGSGLYLVWRRWEIITGFEIVFYWVGCSLAFIFMSTFYFDSERIKWFGMSSDNASGFVFGCLIALGSGLLIIWKRSRNQTSY